MQTWTGVRGVPASDSPMATTLPFNIKTYRSGPASAPFDRVPLPLHMWQLYLPAQPNGKEMVHIGLGPVPRLHLHLHLHVNSNDSPLGRTGMDGDDVGLETLAVPVL